MARNEDGEFELMLGNKQLLSVFFLMVLLLAVCFIGGYLLGRSAAPVITASNQPQQPAPTIPSPAAIEPEAAPSATPPTRTAPQVETAAPEPAKETPAPKEAPKQAPPKQVEAKAKADVKAKVDTKAKTDAKAKSAPASKSAPTPSPVAAGQPIAGRIYLQLSATDKDKAEVMVDLLRRKSFAGIAAPVTERPGLFRVLVGPLAENALTQTKAQLKAAGFPGDEAIRRVF